MHELPRPLETGGLYGMIAILWVIVPKAQGVGLMFTHLLSTFSLLSGPRIVFLSWVEVA